MKKIILGLVLALSAVGQANEEDPGTRYTSRYSCTFTEPFVNVTYDSYSKSVSVEKDGKISLISGASIKSIDKSTDVAVVDKSGVTILILRSELGSDGMSDKEYMLTGVYEGVVGGCDFAFKKIAN